ncbi:MAG TPA: beta-N-acetylhexosaminidase [Thermoanaerobaculia bacterium]|jgi:beta-N-acetylhexosaminidase|nr:beta-N-acetylhexosaminidase [Thermoanaerobaculia bacterium]
MRPAEQVFVGIPGPELDSATVGVLSRFQPGGVVLFKRNVKDEEQLNALVTGLRRLLPEAVLAIDAEGGRVDRLKDVVGPTPPASLLARHATSYSHQAGYWIGQALRLFDIDVDFAPVVDLDRGASDNALDDRYLGATVSDVVPRAQAFLRGLHGGGAAGCLKHFPGLGGAGEDTHYKTSVVYLPAEAMETDLAPFETLGRLAGAIMVSHAVYPAWDSHRPATLSPEILGGLLRGRLGFDGLAISDDMEMKALDEWGDLPERCELAFAAGCDVLLVCHTLSALPEIVERLGRPELKERLSEANRRLEVYRQRLATLRTARDYVAFMRENSRGERLDRVRQALEQLQANA